MSKSAMFCFLYLLHFSYKQIQSKWSEFNLGHLAELAACRRPNSWIRTGDPCLSAFPSLPRAETGFIVEY